MSIVLSVYSQKGFREVTLPERGQTELRVLIRKELFDLNEDVTLSLEKTGEFWELTPEGGFLRMNAKRYKRAVINSGMQLEVELPGRKKITILSAEQKKPFTPYQKYGLAGLQQIRIGWNPGNDIQYQDQPSRERYVSGEHCTITLKNGNWELHDKSKNGTYVNFQRAYGNVILHYGDSIRIMRLNIIFLGNMLAINECDGLRIMIPQVEGGERINQLASPGSGNAAKKIRYNQP